MKKYIIMLWAMFLMGCGTNMKHNEIHQLGFRLAKETGIKELFPMDYKSDLGDGTLVEERHEIDKLLEFQGVICDVTKVASADTKYVKPHLISAYSSAMNSTERGNDNRNIFLDKLSSISYESGNPLLAYVSNWYMQNIFIWDQSRPKRFKVFEKSTF